jgi:hypothetical protein
MAASRKISMKLITPIYLGCVFAFIVIKKASGGFSRRE